MEKVRIKISPSDLKEVKKHLEDNRKIAAIKHLRSTGKAFPPKEGTLPDGTVGLIHRPGLREAKHAVEVMMGTMVRADAAGLIAPQLRIKKVIVEGETGNIELDIEQLQLRCLDGLSQGIPLSEVAAMTELITFIRGWQGDELE
ncbi:MAG: hypothetical protein CMM76_13585 [Rhodospirillaceae bacterium]|nr:hypothetical protein [Rhodospirillaceae bacterium]|tara:strand:+ start:399 stop:830 length:432 start_codon:yes stop_codon:yes gene_type:complete